VDNSFAGSPSPSGNYTQKKALVMDNNNSWGEAQRFENALALV